MFTGSSDISERSYRVAIISDILWNYFAPEAVDAIYQQVMRFACVRRADQYVDESFAEYYLRPREAKSGMATAAGIPGQFASIRGMGNAGGPRHEAPLVCGELP